MAERSSSVALQVQRRGGPSDSSVVAPGNWLAIYWTPGYTRKIPRRIISSIASFAGDRLDPELKIWLNRQDLVGFSGDKYVDVVSIAKLCQRIVAFAFLMAAFTVVSVATGQDFLIGTTFLADIAVLGTLEQALGIRAAMRKLPPGMWFLRVNATVIEVSRCGRTTRLSSDDVESIQLCPIGNRPRPVAIYALLSPKARKRLGLPDARFPLYWAQAPSRIPNGLRIALAEFAPEGLPESLQPDEREARILETPVSCS